MSHVRLSEAIQSSSMTIEQVSSLFDDMKNPSLMDQMETSFDVKKRFFTEYHKCLISIPNMTSATLAKMLGVLFVDHHIPWIQVPKHIQREILLQSLQIFRDSSIVDEVSKLIGEGMI